MVEIQVKQYQQQLEAEINQDRERHGKKPLKDDEAPPSKPETKNIKKVPPTRKAVCLINETMKNALHM